MTQQHGVSMILILQSEKAYDECPRDLILMSSFVAYATGDSVWHIVKNRATGWTGFATIKMITDEILNTRTMYDVPRSIFENA